MRLLLLFLIIAPLTGSTQEYARILEHKTRYIIKDNKNAQIEEYYKIQINSDKGYRYSVYQEYIDEFRDIQDVDIVLYDLHGNKIKKLKKSDGNEYGFSQSFEINDGKMFVINPDYRQFPFIVEVSSKVKLNGFLSLPTWMPRFTFNMSVDNSVLEVVRPEGYKILMNEEKISGTSSVDGDNMIVTRYEVKNLEEVSRKMRYQDFYDLQAKVDIIPEEFHLNKTIGRNSSWQEFGNWFVALNSEPYSLTNETKVFIDNLSAEEPSKKIKAIYEYMQDKTRYVSIQLGIGGFKSWPTEDVEKLGYGDCKALSTYMKNMLEYAGVKSNYILVKAGRDVPDVDKDFPSNQFNHVYLGIPLMSDTTYLECTSQTLPTDYSGSFTDDRNVLWIEKDNSTIIRSRIYSHDENVQHNKTNVAFEKNGDAVVNINMTNKGIFFDEIMIYQSAPGDYINNYNQDKFKYKDFSIKEFKFDHPSRDIPEFALDYKIEVNGLAKIVGDKLIVPVNLTKPIDDYIDQNELMKYFSIKRGLTVEDEIEVSLPDNYWIYELPEKVIVESQFGKYEVTVEHDDKKILIKRKMVFYKGNFVNDQYDEYKAFYDQLIKLERRKLVLNSGT